MTYITHPSKSRTYTHYRRIGHNISSENHIPIQIMKIDYYPIQCSDIQCTRNGTIRATFPGRINQPNVLYDNNHLATSIEPIERGSIHTLYSQYQASELTITCLPSLSLHIDHDAELIVSHRATTNAPAMHVCFLLKGAAAVPSSSIDRLLQVAHIDSPSMLSESIEPVVLCLNDYVHDLIHSKSIQEYHGKDPVTSMPYTFIVIETVIHVASALKGDGGQPLAHRDAWLSPTSLVKTKEGFAQGQAQGHAYDQGQAQEGFVTVTGADGKTGHAMDDSDGNNVMQCDVLPYDADDTEPVLNMSYSIDSFSKQYATSMMFYIVLLVVSVVSFFILPMGYLYFYKMSNHENIPDTPNVSSFIKWFFYNFSSVSLNKWGFFNRFDIASTVTFLVAGVILLGIGFSQTNAALILSGIVLLVSYFIGVAGTKYLYLMQKPIVVPDSIGSPSGVPAAAPKPPSGSSSVTKPTR